MVHFNCSLEENIVEIFRFLNHKSHQFDLRFLRALVLPNALDASDIQHMIQKFHRNLIENVSLAGKRSSRVICFSAGLSLRQVRSATCWTVRYAFAEHQSCDRECDDSPRETVPFFYKQNEVRYWMEVESSFDLLSIAMLHFSHE